jgi:hypothetical protein
VKNIYLNRVAFLTEPFLLFHCDDIPLNRRIMAVLMPGAIAAIAEYNDVPGCTVATLTMFACCIRGFTFSRDTSALLCCILRFLWWPEWIDILLGKGRYNRFRDI